MAETNETIEKTIESNEDESTEIEQVIRIIGKLNLILGLIASFLLVVISDEVDSIGASIGGAIVLAVTSVVSYVLWLGFAIAIEKLKESTKNQCEIIKLLKDNYNLEN